jgi:4-alpha-glucanotransferase
MRIDLYLRYHTHFGESIAVFGNIPELGNDDMDNALPLQYLNEDLWHGSFEIDASAYKSFSYRYLFINNRKEIKKEGEKGREINLKKTDEDITIYDTWNEEGFYENAFFTAPFKEVFFREHKKVKHKKHPEYTHLFKVKAPLASGNQTVCLIGNDAKLNNWNDEEPVLLHKSGDWYSVALDLSGAHFPLLYKYGLYDVKHEKFVSYEAGENRVIHKNGSDKCKTIFHDGFVRFPNNTWRGAGVAIPVFSLRSNNSFGVGEFSDLKLLVDWANEIGLKLIQILPVNDTSATMTWKDSYPYAAISAFALHPIYINLKKVAGKKNASTIKAVANKQQELNDLPQLDYEQVISIKLQVLKDLYSLDNMSFLEEDEYKDFFEENKNWLIGYAAFSYLRDKYKTADFSRWKTNNEYNQQEIEKLTSSRSKQFKQIAFFYFVQYHLHLQLKDAVDYAHKKGIALKGDIPIGIYRYGCDAWTAPQLYNMNMQAGAPPDDFTIKGQNWGFPTYNWKKMEEDHFEWWRQRFHQMSNYFDAFRIDHILGFFRIWSIPVDCVEGILGRFIRALPVSSYEFGERGIWFDYDRFCKPYITDEIISNTFGEQAEMVKSTFLLANNREGYDLKPEYDTQFKVDQAFAAQDHDNKEKIRQGLFDLITNVILYERPGSNKQEFDFRILIDLTSTYQALDDMTKGKVYELYIDYFYRRQDAFWEKEAMKKLPALKDATNMLICGEDLGMVPHSVPNVMKRLGILSLEIQRMPKDIHLQFFHPKDAPYLSVITPSTHDMSTIRGWWEEDRQRTQSFFNTVLGEQGNAPESCEPWVNRAIVLQHLYSPAMWSIFQLQDILGMSKNLRREDPAEERINNPANPNHYWNYRMHLPLEQLNKEEEFNKETRDYICNSGR